MLFDFGFYSSLLLIPFTQGIFYSILLWIKGYKTEQKANYWLSLFIFLCCLFIAPWMLGFAGWYSNQPYRDFMFYVPFQHLYFIGPVIFCYTQSLLNPAFKLTFKNGFHFLPGIVYLVYSLVVFLNDKVLHGSHFFYADGIDKDFDFWYQKTGLVSMIFYFVLSLRFYNQYKKMVFQVVSYAETVQFKWVKNYLIAFLVMLILPVVFDVLSYFFPVLNSYEGSWWFFLLFSVVMFYIALNGYNNSIETKVSFSTSVLGTEDTIIIQENHKEEILEEKTNSEITLETALLEKKKEIEILFTEQKLFQNPELTLLDIANQVNLNIASVSKIINQGFQLNFNDLVNQYRIEAVKKAFQNNEHQKSTLLGIAYDAGFNSKATFNRAFKKYTELTPKEYLNQL
jgi:AraC-like DNA-binding protein